MNTATQIDYRWLEPEEMGLIEPVLEKMNAISINREQSRVVGAFDGERLIGFFVMQLVPHLEPLYVDPDYRNGTVALNLVMEMVQFMKDCNARGAILVAEHPGVEKIAEHFGMERITHPLYSKVNMGDGI